MPYINPARREPLDDGAAPVTPGELNYIITSIVNGYLGGYAEPPNYDAINSAIGVLECAKLELYRRIAAPYEDTKLAQNGEVYTCQL